jgi:hypothetical protein
MDYYGLGVRKVFEAYVSGLPAKFYSCQGKRPLERACDAICNVAKAVVFSP